MTKTVVLLLALIASPAWAQQNDPIRDNHIGGIFWNRGNELLVESHIFDASKVRVGSPWVLGESGGAGAFSGDVTGGEFPGMFPGKRIEVGLLTMGMNRQGGGEVGLFVTKTGTWGNISDAAQVRIWEATSDAFEFKVPISAPNLQQGIGTVVVGQWFMQSPNGLYRTYMQDDGNLVTYKVMSGNWLCATWSSQTGPTGNVCE